MLPLEFPLLRSSCNPEVLSRRLILSTACDLNIDNNRKYKGVNFKELPILISLKLLLK